MSSSNENVLNENSLNENAMPENEAAAAIYEPRLWSDKGWTARVIKNEDDDGWAVAMFLDGESEAALIGPWTMGRDKKSPKPLDATAFSTLIKTASEVIRRHEQHLYAMHHKSVSLETESGRVDVTLEIVPDEDDPYALLAAHDANGEQLAKVRVGPEFKFTMASINAWIEDEFRRPGG